MIVVRMRQNANSLMDERVARFLVDKKAQVRVRPRINGQPAVLAVSGKMPEDISALQIRELPGVDKVELGNVDDESRFMDGRKFLELGS